MLKKVAVLICIFMVVYIGFLLYKNSVVKKEKGEKNKYIDQIKNGLLSYALLKTANKDDLKNFDMNYKNFDGTRLPMFSGYSTSNACLSYIIDKDEFRKCQFYTPTMEDKIVAIEKYLEKNFDSDKKVEEFFNKFIEQIEEGETSENSEPLNETIIEMEKDTIQDIIDEEYKKVEAEISSIPINVSCETVTKKIKDKFIDKKRS
jgi:hypothetical protein